MLWFDNIAGEVPYALAVASGHTHFPFLDEEWGHLGDNLLFNVDNGRLWTQLTDLQGIDYNTVPIAQWESVPQAVREALNNHVFKSSPDADEPDRECPINDENFQSKLDASYINLHASS